MTTLEGIGLGALQGLTEFLPVSSSGHLVLLSSLFKINEPPVALSVLLHAGSLVAILIYFRREIISLVTARRHLIPVLIVGTLPAAAVGIPLKGRMEVLFASPVVAAVGLLVTGAALVVSERLGRGDRPLESLRLSDGFWVGVAQAIALAPGVSRSGMTVGASLASGLERGAAVAFAFLLGMLAIAGAGVLELRKIAGLGAASPLPMAAGFLASVLVSLASLSFLTLVVRRKCLVFFAMYCFAVGSAVLLAKLAGVW